MAFKAIDTTTKNEINHGRMSLKEAPKDCLALDYAWSIANPQS